MIYVCMVCMEEVMDGEEVCTYHTETNYNTKEGRTQRVYSYARRSYALTATI